MITVNISIDRDKRECSLLVKGHAGQAEIGKDIVCASASILACTVAQIVCTAKDNEELADDPTVIVESGDTTISCRAKDDIIFRDLLQTFYTATIGYVILENKHPQYVEVIYDGKPSEA